MNLAIDIGNTRTKLGVFNDGLLVARYDRERLEADDLLDLATNQNVQSIIFSNVGEVQSADWPAVLQDRFLLMELNTKTPLPIRNNYHTPETLGKDRLAAVVGAYQLYPGAHCLVIDAGTCITYDLLHADGVFLGGNIAPGVEMRLRAMHAFTARLPLVERGETEDWLGYSTLSALRNGGQWGAVWEMEAFIAHCRQFFSPLRVVLTGGDADFFAKSLKSEIFVNPDLVLIGLNKILDYNVKLAE